MAVGAQVGAWTSTANNGTLDLQPGSSIEWLVHTLKAAYGAAMEVYFTSDGSTFTKMDQYAGGSVGGLTHRLTNTQWIRLKNVSGGTVFIGYEGVQTV